MSSTSSDHKQAVCLPTGTSVTSRQRRQPSSACQRRKKDYLGRLAGASVLIKELCSLLRWLRKQPAHELRRLRIWRLPRTEFSGGLFRQPTTPDKTPLLRCMLKGLQFEPTFKRIPELSSQVPPTPTLIISPCEIRSPTCLPRAHSNGLHSQMR